jgi:hypothetical protein
MLERRQLAGALPDLNVIPINKPHCKLDCGVVIDAVKVVAFVKMAVLTDEVNPVKRHAPKTGARSPEDIHFVGLVSVTTVST